MRDLDLGVAVLHLDVAQARQARLLRRRRRLLLGIGGLALLAALGLAVWQRAVYGVVVVYAADAAAVVRVGDAPMTAAGEALVWRGAPGVYTVTAEAPGVYPQRRTVTVTVGMTTTATFPPGRPRPALLLAPRPAPGAVWRMVTADARGGWRAVAGGAGDAPPAVMRVTATAVTRAPDLDRYPVADTATLADGRRVRVVWEPDPADRSGARGRLTLTSPDGRVETLTTDQPVDGAWWSPDGAYLVLALRAGSGSVVRVWDAAGGDGSPLHAPAVSAMPTPAAALEWAPNGAAAVLFSAPAADGAAADALLLTLPRGGRGVQTATLAPGPARPAGLAPLGWGSDGLFWVAQYADRLALTYWPFDGGSPLLLGSVPPSTLALHVADPQRITLAVQQADGRIGLQTWPDGALLATMDDLPAAAAGRAGARWRGWTMALALNDDLWHAVCDPALLAPPTDGGGA
jgi:hypothetical protein